MRKTVAGEAVFPGPCLESFLGLGDRMGGEQEELSRTEESVYPFLQGGSDHLSGAAKEVAVGLPENWQVPAEFGKVKVMSNLNVSGCSNGAEG